ncbi:pentatricopeptide repeat-containing protein [Artemisia annua]|uniref:Pentatricopeptide repeat-containing protein n=1 Tax=Artemisia annua TaxID=35608 RepID=A0A2U1MKP1_ARTAN|nr:pentatricopeptide repeat-containing protein [Artemisia annua]
MLQHRHHHIHAANATLHFHFLERHDLRMLVQLQLHSSRQLFDQMPYRDIVSWILMITGCVRNGNLAAARKLFDQMPSKDAVSWNAMLSGYAQSGCVEEARKNGRVDEARRLFEANNEDNWDVIWWNCLMGGYEEEESGDLCEARKLFDESPVRDVYTWTAMASGYVQNGMEDEPRRNVSSWNTMITGFALSGFIDIARDLFEKMPRRDCISWGAIISGYAHLGYNEEALRLFVEMKRSGEKANRSIFSCILSTYAEIAALELRYQLHAQLVKMKLTLYEEISDKDIVSWNTIIDGYAWHGFGQEAVRVFESMKRSGVKPDQVTMYKYSDSLNRIFNETLVLHAPIASGRWADVGAMRSKMRDTNVKKVPGYSWLEVQNKINGYISPPKLVLHDVEEEEKEHMLRYHSEKLAVAFGILNIQGGRPIRAFKNLRVCANCHKVINHISKIKGRLISVRDSHRFHHFRDVGIIGDKQEVFSCHVGG